MDLTLSDDQRLLQESVERFTTDAYNFEKRSAALASEEGFSRAVWKSFANLGWLALPLSEEAGGLGGSEVDTGILMEAFGKALVVEPYLSTILLGARLIASVATEAQQKALLPDVIAGETLLSFAHSEKATRIDPNAITTSATHTSEGWVLRGEKIMALGGPSANQFIVSAQIGGESGIGLFLVSPKSEGLITSAFELIDGQRASNLALNDVRVGEEMLLGESRDAQTAIDEVVDRAIIATSAAAVGSVQALLVKSAEYLKTRIQFGEPLSHKQVLRHRIADMALRCEEARASALRAAVVADSRPTETDRRLAASSAKVKVARASRFIGEQAVQLHGGMGVTEELDIGSYFRSLITFELLFGSADYHRRRFGLLRQSQAAVA